MADLIYLDPPQPVLAGTTVYAELVRAGSTLATVPMGTVDGSGRTTGAIPDSIDSGPLTAMIYRQLGASPDPSNDWPIATTSFRWEGGEPARDQAGFGSTVRDRSGADPWRSTLRDRSTPSSHEGPPSP